MSDNPHLVQRLLTLSSQELSRMEEALPPNSPIVLDAAEESRAHALWAEMAGYGWLATQPDRIENFVTRKIFTVTHAGRAPIVQLLAELRRDPEFLARMATIFDGLCKLFADELLRRVHAAGGTGQDLAALTAGTVVHIIAQNFHQSGAAANAICERIRRGAGA
ncbi:MAG TPA: hypothetical protein VGG48_12725 [Rhizomicrobium sp.]|jgi:hypothetical protein